MKLEDNDKCGWPVHNFMALVKFSISIYKDNFWMSRKNPLTRLLSIHSLEKLQCPFDPTLFPTCRANDAQERNFTHGVVRTVNQENLVMTVSKVPGHLGILKKCRT